MTYENRTNFVRAIKYIYQNLDQPINLEAIADNVGISLSTLKRIFLEATGTTAGGFIRRLRMEQAFRTLQCRESSVLEAALHCGYEDASAFARSFKKNFGYSPSFARKKMNIVNELESIVLEEPEIVEIQAFVIQAVTEQGRYFECAPLAWKKLEKHLSNRELDDDFTGTFIGMGHDNPHDGDVAEDKVRFSAGIVCDQNDIGCEKRTVSGGFYAKFNFSGKINNMGLAYHYIYGEWSNQANETINDNVPAYIMFDKFPSLFENTDVSIYVPLLR